jgi:tetratricopeptide (TPR) repeat protein
MGRPEIQKALLSISEQSFPNIEVVVIDALGSGHPQMPDRCGSHPLLLCSSGTRLPRAAAANVGLESGHGEFFIFLDDDDYFDSDHIELLVDALTMNSNAMVAYSGLRLLDESAQEVGFMSEPFNIIEMHNRNLIPICAALFSKKLVEIGCRFDPQFEILEDWDFWLQCARHTPFIQIPDISCNYFTAMGTSGCGMGAHENKGKIAIYSARLYKKWERERQAHNLILNEYIESGQALLKAGREREAGRLFQRVLDIHPDNINALNLLAMTWLAGGQALPALPLIKRAISLRGQMPALHYNLGLVLEALGEVEQARSAYQRAHSLDARFQPAKLKYEALSKIHSPDNFNN